MSDKNFTSGMTIQQIKSALVATMPFDGTLEFYEHINQLAHEIQQLVDPERDWICPFFDRDEEERVLESVAHSVVTSHLTIDMALDILDWAASMTKSGYNIDDIKHYFNVGAAHGGRLP